MSASASLSGRIALDGAAGTLVVTSLLQWLPPLAAAVGMVYYLLLISENKRFLQFVNWIGQFRLPARWKVELVDDWRQGTRWLSVQFIAAAAALQAVLIAFPLQSYIPPEWMKAATAVCLLGAFLGRFVKQKDGTRDTDKPVQS